MNRVHAPRFGALLALIVISLAGCTEESIGATSKTEGMFDLVEIILKFAAGIAGALLILVSTIPAELSQDRWVAKLTLDQVKNQRSTLARNWFAVPVFLGALVGVAVASTAVVPIFSGTWWLILVVFLGFLGVTGSFFSILPVGRFTIGKRIVDLSPRELFHRRMALGGVLVFVFMIDWAIGFVQP